MALAHATKGSTHTAQAITWLVSNTSTPLNLTGATISGVIRRVSNGVERAVTGTCTVTDAANGVFSWTYSTADTSESGFYSVVFKATYSGGVEFSLRQYWTVYD